jgi:hypothetical protein
LLSLSHRRSLPAVVPGDGERRAARSPVFDFTEL